MRATLALVMLTACNGQAVSPPPPPYEPPPSCTSPQVGSSPMRRLRRVDFDASARSLLGVTGTYTGTFPPEEKVLGFDNQAAALSVSQLYVEQVMEAAERISAEIDVPALTGCPAGSTSMQLRACAQTFIAHVGERAWRRPLTAPESQALSALYTQMVGLEGNDVAIRVVLQAMLQAPQFLYRLELKRDGEMPGQVVALDGFELATRLSYFFWGEGPDDVLWAAAVASELSTKEQVEAQARRLLMDPRARGPVDDFFAQWLELERLPITFKTTALYNRVRPYLAKEMSMLAADIYWNAKAKDLFTASYTFGNNAQGIIYGVTPDAGFSRIELDPATRPGLFTRAGWLSIQAKPAESSPLHRGKFIRERVLCQPMPDPPPGIPALPDLMPGQTTREHFAAHTADPSCSVCHVRMDPIGFGLERYDEMGRYRTMQAGKPIDETGELSGAGDIAGPFDGGVELMTKLSSGELVQSCLVRQSFRFGLGRAETGTDDCSRQALLDRFNASGGDLKELAVGLAVSDAFRFRVSP